MEKVPNTSTPTEVGSSDVTIISRTFFLPAESDGVDQETGGGGVAVTREDMRGTSSAEVMTAASNPADNFTEFTVWTEAFWNSSTSPALTSLVPSEISLANDTNVSVVTSLIPGEDEASCVEWEAAQHNLFQTANLFFAAAFIVPRSFKQSLLLLRYDTTFCYTCSSPNQSFPAVPL
jgi:hypothetical protein